MITELTQNPEESRASYDRDLPVYHPEVLIFDSSEEVDQFAADLIIDQIAKKPNSVFTLPTGSTPKDVYGRLVEAYRAGAASFSDLTIFNLDEYWPLDPSNPASYASYMHANFLDHVNANLENWHIPQSDASDLAQEVEKFSGELAMSQPVNLAVLGIGPATTCHIGFNEKGSADDSRTRYVALDEETFAVNSAQFSSPETAPKGAITQGVADILEARKILLIAKGKSKAWGINRTLKGSVSADAPSSFLRLHPNTTFVLDKEAAQYLS